MRVLSLVFASFIVLCSVGQAQHNHWFMGFNAALDFNSTPANFLNGMLSTDEGCASIADSNGQLLFFSNGETVWNRNQNVMPNGVGLYGHFSSSQSALIAPDPSDTNKYFIFTTPAEAGTWSGESEGYYSIIDISLNNGLGDVTIKNVPISNLPMTERLTATRHANGQDIWIVYHRWDSQEYHAYLLSCAGIQGPIISDVGYHVGPDSQGYTNSAISCMKLNRQGTKLASVWTDPVLSTPSVFQSQMIVELFDFDNATGLISNLQADTIGPGNDILKSYGVEFSPNGNLLYVDDHGIFNGISGSRIYQYDLSVPNPMNTRLEVGSGNPAHGSMQLGPDGKIYIARLNGANYLSAIEQPNVIGLGCNYMSNAVSLGAGVSTWGLPNHWDTYPDEQAMDPISWTDSTICDGAVLIDASVQHPFHTISYLWNTGENTSSISVSDAGMYSVEIVFGCSTLYDTVHVSAGGLEVELGEDVLICEGNKIELTVPTEADNILWSTGETNETIIVQDEGMIGVIITDSLNCISSDSISITVTNCDCPLYIPNAFSPNGDGVNDLFTATMDCDPLSYQINVFDRWGQLVFSSSDPNLAWNGSILSPGVYVYSLQLSWQGFQRIERDSHIGHVVLLR